MYYICGHCLLPSASKKRMTKETFDLLSITYFITKWEHFSVRNTESPKNSVVNSKQWAMAAQQHSLNKNFDASCYRQQMMCKKCVCRSTAPAQIGRLLIAFSGLTKNRSYCACDEELPAWPAVTRYTDLQFICAALVSSSICCLNNFYALQVGGSWRNLQMSPVLDPLPDKENRLLNLFNTSSQQRARNEINASNLLSLKNFSKSGTCPFFDLLIFSKTKRLTSK